MSDSYDWGGAGELTFRLQVSVDEAHKVEVFQRCCDLGCVETCIIFRYAFPRTGL